MTVTTERRKSPLTYRQRQRRSHDQDRARSAALLGVRKFGGANAGRRLSPEEVKAVEARLKSEGRL